MAFGSADLAIKHGWHKSITMASFQYSYSSINIYSSINVRKKDSGREREKKYSPNEKEEKNEKGGDNMPKNKKMDFDSTLEDLLNKFESPAQAKEAIYRILFLMISRIVEEAIDKCNELGFTVQENEAAEVGEDGLIRMMAVSYASY